MNRFASPILKVAFEGPDVQEQSLYELCRVRKCQPAVWFISYQRSLTAIWPN